QLRRRQLVVDDDEIGAHFGAGVLERLDLAGSEERCRIRTGAFLQQPQRDLGAGGEREPFQLDETLLRLGAMLGIGDQADQRRALRYRSHVVSRILPRILMIAADSHHWSDDSTRSQGRMPARTSVGCGPYTSTIVEGAPPGVTPPSITIAI